jgi:N utilization substance protein B
VKQAEAREQALGALYAADSLELEHVDLASISGRAGRLAEGAWDHRDEIDALISAESTSWRIERMPVVDRNILRLSVYELVSTDLSIAIIISEAVELAKKFSTAKSSAFINGVLSAVAAGDREFEIQQADVESQDSTE